jgi:nicotinate-nucleotide pyrophosphorylase (carboxylating)
MNRYYTNPVNKLEQKDFETLIRLALAEDMPDHDITSESIFVENKTCKAKLFAKETGIFCGSQIASEINSQLGNKFSLSFLLKDGDQFEVGQTILNLEGNLLTVLRAERPLLNFLQYLSGIATEANKISSKYKGRLMIFDTRKTLPAYRKLAKYAVYMGGACNHRIHLSDMALIKDNHVVLSGSIINAVRSVREKFPSRRVELEIDGLHQLDEALLSQPDIILLDNFSVTDTKIAFDKIKSINPEIQIECSGGITPEKLEALSEIGIMGVSMGYLTHTTRFLDLSLEIES